MLKIMGGLIVVVASLLFGFSIKNKMKFECEFTESLINGFDTVKEDIRYNSDYLLSSLKKTIAVSGKSSEFFQKICDEMELGKSADEALEVASLVVPSDNIKNLLFDTSEKIGKTDIEGQIAFLNLLIERLKIYHKKQLEFYEKQSGIYPKFGFAFGVLITILLV